MRRAPSGTKGLIKRHERGCDNRADPTRCDCSWIGQYRHVRVRLHVWARQAVDPRSKKHAGVVFNRLKAAVDAKTFRPEGEVAVVGDGQRLADFLLEWRTHYAEVHGLRANSLPAMLGVIRSELGAYSLEQLAARPVELIERWLDRRKVAKGWRSANTWNRYHELLRSIFGTAVDWGRLAVNPMAKIGPRVGSSQKFGVRVEESVEDRLLEACDRLNRPQHQPNRSALSWEAVDGIRARVAAGELQSVVARDLGVSPATVCSIVKGETWNREALRVGTKGTEMRRRVIGAVDGGLRAGEMMRIQLKHVEARPLKVERDGVLVDVVRIVLPAELTKGGQTTGELEYVYAATDRFKALLTERRFKLKNNPAAYVFGTEAGGFQKGFRRMWRELFTLAGLDYGRDRGLVWHTLRHEFVSRLAERTDPVVAQELARHRDLDTTQRYFHARRSRVLAAAAGLQRVKA